MNNVTIDEWQLYLNALSNKPINKDKRSFCLNKPNLLKFYFAVLDSWGKIESGLFYANLKWLGSYQECLAVRTQKFKPKYCFITFGKIEYEVSF